MALYLGFDSSTQGLKALVVDAQQGRIVASEAVNYGRDLSAFRCPQGFLENPDPLVKQAAPLMWVAALDLALERLHKAGAPLGQVKAISGSGQQHGSVYLNASFAAALGGLDPARPLAEQLSGIFARPTAPIWMDSSTSEECREIDRAVGPRLQQDTGSPAIERFTGPQVRKFWKESPRAYEDTARVHLVSSFMCSILIGGDAPIDYGDGAGMNLLNLHTLQWDAKILDATAPRLAGRLPPVVPSARVAGSLHPCFARFGLTPGIPVIAWSGDNPNSLVGVGAAEPGAAVISLGTSDVFFASMADMRTDPNGYGHVFGNPAGGFMSLICFKNGSLAREQVKDACGVDWDFFGGTAFADTSPGNGGNLMLPWFVPEITPLVLKAGVHLRGDAEFTAGRAGAAARIRAVVESQALAMRRHAAWIGEGFRTVRVTGGASRSAGLVRTLADVFQAPVEKISIPDSAALGAALRAAQAAGGYGWSDLAERFAAPVETVMPDRSLAGLYAERLDAYGAFEDEVRKSLA